jgi:hypothetical protein
MRDKKEFKTKNKILPSYLKNNKKKIEKIKSDNKKEFLIF